MTSTQVTNANIGLPITAKAKQNGFNLVKDSFSIAMSTKNNDYGTKMENTKAKFSKEYNTKDANPASKYRACEKFAKVEKGMDEMANSVDQAVVEIKEGIASEMNITVEELENIMETMGLCGEELLDFTNLPQLLAKITGEDSLFILTDESLSESLNTLVGMVREKVGELASEANMTPLELMGMIEDAVNEKSQAKEIPVFYEKLVDTAQTEETTKTVEKNEEVTKIVTDNGLQQNTENVTKEAGTKENEIGKSLDVNQEEILPEKNVQSGGEEKKDNTGDNPNTFQTFQQEIRNTLEVAMQKVTTSFETVDAENIMKQIVEYIKVGIGTKVTSMEMQLHPANLGTLNLQVEVREGSVIAQFAAENETVKAVIESQIVQLKENLQEQGLKVDAVEVTVAQKEYHESPGQNMAQGEQSQQPNKQQRRINLRGIRTLDELDFQDMGEAEAVAAKILLQDGNTVDFKA